MVLERGEAPTDDRTDGGNVQLMEARLTELFSSLRALYRSNKELAEALKSVPNDDDFRQALEENWTTMRRQRELAMELVRDMKARGTNIDMPQDICDMNIPAWKQPSPHHSHEDEKQQSSDEAGGEGVYL
jgi:viroplasmin and RNaseH domain-containing protein